MTNMIYKYLHLANYKDIPNWSVQYADEEDLGFTNKYPMARIGAFLVKSKDIIEVEDDVEYKQVTIKINNGGVVPRNNGETILGTKIGTKRQHVVHAGQFIMSKIDARNGAYGIVPAELEGAIVTNDFPVFDVDTEKIIPQFLVLVSTTEKFIEFARKCSSGTTNRKRIDIDAFLNQQIPLPAIDEQRTLVSAFNNKISQSEVLEKQAAQVEQDIEDYLLSELGIKQKGYTQAEPIATVASEPQMEYVVNNRQLEDRADTYHWGDEIKKEYKYLKFVRFKDVIEWGYDRINATSPLTATYPLVKLKELITEGYRGKSPIYKESNSSFILNQKCNRWNEIDLRYKKNVDKKWLLSIKKVLFTREDDILINSTGEGTLGRATVITKDYTNLLYDSHLLLIRVGLKILPNYLVLVLNSSFGQDQINAHKAALATKQTELGLDNLKKIQIPLPSVEVQSTIVEHINKQKNQIKQLRLQAENLRKEALVEFEKEIFE